MPPRRRMPRRWWRILRTFKADWGPATYDVRNVGVMNVSYDLPFGNGRQMSERNERLGERHRRRMDVEQHRHDPVRISLHAAIELQSFERRMTRATQSGRPGIPPSPGPVILGGTTQWFNPQAFMVPASGNLRQRRKKRADGPRARHMGFFRAEGHRISSKDSTFSSARRFSIS